MANWKYKLELKDLWKARDEGKLTIQELGKKVAERIRQATFYMKHKNQIRDILREFDCVEEDVEEFDNILSDLYDWADSLLLTRRGEMQRKMCWVSTHF